jgi:hypothetical protein
LKVLLHHFSKVKSQKEVAIQFKSRVFLLFLLNDRRIRIQEAQKHVNPLDPDPDSDPQHCQLPNFPPAFSQSSLFSLLAVLPGKHEEGEKDVDEREEDEDDNEDEDDDSDTDTESEMKV